MRINIFVYGTLKQGESRAYVLARNPDNKFQGMATLPGFSLKSIASRQYPCLIPNADGNVVGEIWEVDQSLLDGQLDSVEGVRYGLYRRIEVAPRYIDNNAQVRAITYEFTGSPERYPTATEFYNNFNGKEQQELADAEFDAALQKSKQDRKAKKAAVEAQPIEG